jgi:hypothetical protein
VPVTRSSCPSSKTVSCALQQRQGTIGVVLPVPLPSLPEQVERQIARHNVGVREQLDQWEDIVPSPDPMSRTESRRW